MKLSRRGALLGILATAGATLASLRFPWQVALGSPVEDILLELLQVVAVPDPLHVGEFYLRALSDLPERPEKLMDSVFGDLPAAPVDVTRELAEALREKAQRQFEAGEMMQVGGWILAPVEVELCALIALDVRSRR